MANSSLEPALTVVVVDNASPADLLRCVQQVVRTGPRDLDVAVASMRSPRLPAGLSRRVRRLVAPSSELLDAAVLAEAMSPRLVVVTSAAATVRHGWVEEVLARIAIYRDVITAIDATSGGMLLYPPSVTTVDVVAVPWLTSTTLTARGRTLHSDSMTSISAVLIVKNEEDVLDKCLSALTRFVDEVIVYDTGSTDATMDIARRHDVVLVEGYWDDHFANARNRALAHATREWILQVDADETIEGDADELRARLAVETSDQLHVTIVSSAWQGVRSGLETLPIRIFRRGTSEWVGALHEYPRPVDGSAPTLSAIPAPVRLMHSGYELGKVIDRQKTHRNIDLARRELDEAPIDSPMRAEMLSNLARSLMWANKVEEAIPYFEELRQTPGNPTAICMTGRPAIDVMLQVGRTDEADAWIERLAESGESPGNTAVQRARRFIFTGDLDAAVRELEPFIEGMPGGADPWSTPFDRAQLELVMAEVDLARGETTSAAERFVGLLPHSSGLLNLNTLLTTFVETGKPLVELATLAPEALIARSVREASAFHPSGALAWFDALHQVHPEDVRPIVAGNLFAGRSDWRTALTWSVRAREVGLEDACALRALAERDSAPGVDRSVCWALLFHAFGDDDAGDAFSISTLDLDDSELKALARTLDELGVRLEAPSISMPLDATENLVH